MAITLTEAEQQAFAFLMQDLEIFPDCQQWFAILSSRFIKDWYVVEIGVVGLPDKWIVQVYDSGECDPSYTFSSPLFVEDTVALPQQIADLLTLERRTGGLR